MGQNLFFHLLNLDLIIWLALASRTWVNMAWNKSCWRAFHHCKKPWQDCCKDHVERGPSHAIWGPRNAGESGLELPALVEPSADITVTHEWARARPPKTHPAEPAQVITTESCYEMTQIATVPGWLINVAITQVAINHLSETSLPKYLASQLLSKLKSNLLFFLLYITRPYQRKLPWPQMLG